MQVALLRQGWFQQLSMFVSQFSPSKPVSHWQV
jgi:hypothetical protein